MIASRIAQLRALGAELGFDQAARQRMGISPDPRNRKPASGLDKYLDDDPADRFFT
jgi:hypothetical protein